MKAPTHLQRHGRELWRRIQAEYDVNDAGGLALLTTAAECLDRMRAAQKAISEDGEVVKDRYGQAKVHPACGLEKDARVGLLAALKQLNLDLEPLRDRPGRPADGFGWKGAK